MQQSDMNHPTPSLPPSPPSSPARCAAAHSQRASDTIYGKRKTRCGHLSIDGLSETTLFKKKKKKRLSDSIRIKHMAIISTTESIQLLNTKVHIRFQSEARNANGRLRTISQAALNIQTKIIICGLAPFWLGELHLSADSEEEIV